MLLSPRPENDFVNVRELPDLNARLIGQINKGQSVPVRGKNADGSWYQINFPAGADGAGWVYAPVVSVNGPIEDAAGGHAARGLYIRGRLARPIQPA
ncbi:MAG: hypothetical protein KatS3mg052_2302 [Candidatus Roseilinea sp.]|nr:MAG: hypothetical protein KatS3mg052_2302 [Candidatus Roseilinea sp.]